MKIAEIRSLARDITEDFFTNGHGAKGARLIIESPKYEDLGGWCKRAAKSRIEHLIRKRVEKKGKK
jgi:hypothetical protein